MNIIDNKPPAIKPKLNIKLTSDTPISLRRSSVQLNPGDNKTDANTLPQITSELSGNSKEIFPKPFLRIALTKLVRRIKQHQKASIRIKGLGGI